MSLNLRSMFDQQSLSISQINIREKSDPTVRPRPPSEGFSKQSQILAGRRRPRYVTIFNTKPENKPLFDAAADIEGARGSCRERMRREMPTRGFADDPLVCGGGLIPLLAVGAAVEGVWWGECRVSVVIVGLVDLTPFLVPSFAAARRDRRRFRR